MRRTISICLIALTASMGCADKQAPPVKPSTSGSQGAKPQASAEPQPAAPDSPAAERAPSVAANPIEDPPVIGTPQEAFNFPRAPLEMPKVLLTEGESKSSLVKVGDTMPDLSLPDLKGRQQQLSKLFGPKLTVVVFWNSNGPYAVEEIGDLGPVVAERFASHGVAIVGIAEQSPAAAANATVERAGADFINLIDVNGKGFEQVATAELPRTYLLDVDGKVLWFDLEYSRSTRRDLLRAIQFALLNPKEGA